MSQLGALGRQGGVWRNGSQTFPEEILVMLRIPDATLRRVQALSGIVFLVFLLLHLGNTALAAFGQAPYDGAQRVLRKFYQAWPVETLILGALIVHLLVAIMRKLAGRPAPAGAHARWHRNAGLFLALFVGGHVFAVRGPSWFLGFHPEFSGIAFSLAYVPGYFYPYYLALGVAGLFHGLWGLRVAAQRLGLAVPLGHRGIQFATGAGAVSIAAALLGFGGWLFDVGNPFDNAYARLVLRITGGEIP
jgi:succinate dehydrogenase/fumarate reductase cytochrome b subunit